jgi:tetratricopeptide (TPR) repeat protein
MDPSILDPSILRQVGEIAGLGGIAVGGAVVIFQDVIRKNVFASLTKEQSYRLLRLITLLAWSVAVLGLAAWSAESFFSPKKLSVAEVKQIVLDTADKNIFNTFQFAELANELGVTRTALEGFFATLGRKGVPPAKFVETLYEIANDHKELLKRLSELEKQAPFLAPLIAQAKQAADAGLLDQARDLYDEIDKKNSTAMVQRALTGAQIAGQRGQLEIVALDYVKAAEHFAQAAVRVPQGYEEQRLNYLQQEASALAREANRSRNAAVVSTAIERYVLLLELQPANRFPLDWSRNRRRLGRMMVLQGSVGPEQLREAYNVIESALSSVSREKYPREWADTIIDMGAPLMQLAERYGDAGAIEKTITLLESALDVCTKDKFPDCWRDIQTTLGYALWRSGKFQVAANVLTAVLNETDRRKSSDTWARLHLNLGKALTGLGRSARDPSILRKAIEHFESAQLEWANSRTLGMSGLGEIYFSLGSARFYIGMIERSTPLLTQAIANFDAALEYWPGDRQASYVAKQQRTFAQYGLSQVSGSVEELRTATTSYRDLVRESNNIAPSMIVATNNLRDLIREKLVLLGNSQRDQEAWEDALVSYTEAIELRKEAEPEDWEVIYYRAIAHDKLGHGSNAEADLLKALELSPNQPFVLNYLGYLWVERDFQIDRALDMLLVALELRPNSAIILDSVGRAYFKKRAYEKAVDKLERAVAIDPSNGDLLDHLGDCYFQMSRFDEALKTWEKARAANPPMPVAQRLEEKISAYKNGTESQPAKPTSSAN